jgi:hypothetical protein
VGAEQAIGLSTASAAAQPRWHRLAPVSRRWPWITGGLLLQLIGAGAPVVYVLDKAHKEGLGGQISRATLTLAWRQAVHSHAGLALMISGAVVFVVGSMLVARPFVKSWVALFVAVPIAALAGVLVLGLAAVVVTLIVAGADELFGGIGGSGGGGSTSSAAGEAAFDTVGSDFDYGSFKRRRKQDEPPDQGPLAGGDG